MAVICRVNETEQHQHVSTAINMRLVALDYINYNDAGTKKIKST